jgi:hypothetical protein
MLSLRPLFLAPLAALGVALPAARIADSSAPVPTVTLAPHVHDHVGDFAPVALDSALLSGYRWRNIGPDRGGRSIAS